MEKNNQLVTVSAAITPGVFGVIDTLPLLPLGIIPMYLPIASVNP
ncbi:hypothetical protein NWP21_16715 [Anabaenopsis sp. FSS-46]|nr:hypothetical protein [Anabaenopsis sp. FSS-46]MDH6100451.1 hypothetical protein [Anabaenopsis sp. FSS-46]